MKIDDNMAKQVIEGNGDGSLPEDKLQEMNDLCGQVRRDVIHMIFSARSGNPGSALSSVEFLVYLYFHHLRIRVDDPGWHRRDRFILSKGHAAPALYSVMAHRGFLPPDELTTFRKFESRLQTHPEYGSLPGLDFTSGSLAQGLSAGVGMALSLGLQHIQSRVMVYLGDGEIQEGQVWEAAMSAAHFKLDNLIAIIDYNKLQGDGSVTEVMGIEPFADKWRSFGWLVHEVDGHDLAAIQAGLTHLEHMGPGPKVLIGHTVKGKGISFMEGNNRWHVGGHMTEEDRDNALKELDERSMAYVQ